MKVREYVYVLEKLDLLACRWFRVDKFNSVASAEFALKSRDCFGTYRIVAFEMKPVAVVSEVDFLGCEVDEEYDD